MNRTLVSAVLYLAAMLFSATLASPAFADSCDDVLQYTGRERNVFYSHDMQESYFQYASQQNVNGNASATIPLEGIPVMFGLSGSDTKAKSSVSFQQSEIDYFNDANTVFAPAVQAWSSCKAASARGLSIKPTLAADRTTLIFDISPSTGSPETFDGVIVTPIGSAVCAFEGRAITAAYRRPLPNRHTSLVCTRRGPTKTDASVTVRFDSAQYVFTMVHTDPPMQNANPSDATQAQSIQGCTTEVVYPPAPFDREIIFGTIDLDGYWQHQQTSAITVWINGQKIVDDNGRPNKNLGPADHLGSRNGTFEYNGGDQAVIRANIPIALKMVTAAGFCNNAHGIVYIPKAN